MISFNRKIYIKSLGVYHSFEKMKLQLCFSLEKTFSSYHTVFYMCSYVLIYLFSNGKIFVHINLNELSLLL